VRPWATCHSSFDSARTSGSTTLSYMLRCAVTVLLRAFHVPLVKTLVRKLLAVRLRRRAKQYRASPHTPTAVKTKQPAQVRTTYRSVRSCLRQQQLITQKRLVCGRSPESSAPRFLSTAGVCRQSCSQNLRTAPPLQQRHHRQIHLQRESTLVAYFAIPKMLDARLDVLNRPFSPPLTTHRDAVLCQTKPTCAMQ